MLNDARDEGKRTVYFLSPRSSVLSGMASRPLSQWFTNLRREVGTKVFRESRMLLLGPRCSERVDCYCWDQGVQREQIATAGTKVFRESRLLMLVPRCSESRMLLLAFQLRCDDTSRSTE
ncbi:hypothetical protein J6590_020504 [Homalodisca vitripennis]|nr:hypothetical protein J6590_020504 [Homalodisca vitripennis]